MKSNLLNLFIITGKKSRLHTFSYCISCGIVGKEQWGRFQFKNTTIRIFQGRSKFFFTQFCLSFGFLRQILRNSVTHVRVWTLLTILLHQPPVPGLQVWATASSISMTFNNRSNWGLKSPALNLPKPYPLMPPFLSFLTSCSFSPLLVERYKT